MFTGIIEEIGTVTNYLNNKKSFSIGITGDVIFDDLKIGDSVAVNGICLTTTKKEKKEFFVDIMPETISKTSLLNIKKGSKVNLERAVTLSTRLGGHLVSGHIDGIATISSIKEDADAFRYKFKSNDEIMKYIIYKGSIAIDGTSLTISNLFESEFEVSLIPLSQKMSILGFKKVGDIVNIECDIIGKYIEKFTTYNKKSIDSKISTNFLKENGFL